MRKAPICFLSFLPGRYQIEVSRAGFKTYQRSDIDLTATERLVIPPIRLEVGDLTQTISVEAEVVRVQTSSAERSGLIDTFQFQKISVKGRDYLAYLRLLPGVVDTRNREAPGWNNLTGVNINGNRSGTINLTLDGVPA